MCVCVCVCVCVCFVAEEVVFLRLLTRFVPVLRGRVVVMPAWLACVVSDEVVPDDCMQALCVHVCVR